MRSHPRILLAAPFLAFLALSTPALSQTVRPYLGVGIGGSDARGACDGVAGPGVSCDETDAAVKLFGGFQFNRYAAMEIGYTDLGAARAHFEGFGSQTFGTTGVEFTGIGMLPLDRHFSLFGRLGLYSWRAEFRDRTGFVGSSSATGTDLTYGLGVQYDLYRSTAVRAEWQRYKNVGDPDTTGQGDIDFIGSSLIVRF